MVRQTEDKRPKNHANDAHDAHDTHEAEHLEIPERHRHHVRHVRTWSLARGRPIDVLGLTVLILAKEECVDAPLHLWTLDDLAEFVWTQVAQWCSVYGLRRPSHLAETLWLYLTFLDEAGQLAPGSYDLRSLQASLMAYGGLDRFGRSRASMASRSKPGSKPGSRNGGDPRSSPGAAIIPFRPRPDSPRPRSPRTLGA
jgi:hypothetical protein